MRQIASALRLGDLHASAAYSEAVRLCCDHVVGRHVNCLWCRRSPNRVGQVLHIRLLHLDTCCSCRDGLGRVYLPGDGACAWKAHWVATASGWCCSAEAPKAQAAFAKYRGDAWI